MSICVPPEPLTLKKSIKDLMDKYSSERWHADKFLVWFGNRIPSYLWTECRWKYPLTKEGWTWQSFLKLLSKRTDNFVRWARGELNWESLINEIIRDLKASRRRRVVLDEWL